MSTANQALARRWFEEVWNKKRRDAIEEMLHPDSVFHEGSVDTGSAEFHGYFDRMHSTFSDIRIVVHDALEDGDKVCLRWSCCMKHTADGKPVETTGISIMRVADGKLIEGWQNWDMVAVLEAIGVREKGTNALAVSA
jgi:ketosteroid isomerase-like protein